MLPTLSPSQFVELLNQSIELTMPVVEVEGEILNFRVSRGKFAYFDIADENAKLKCFAMVFGLPGPVEDGMKVRVTAVPRLHPQFNFSLNVNSLQFSGEGSIKKANELLRKQLEAEGLFATERKRPIPFPPARVGLITSTESAAYKDFIKVIGERWGGLEIEVAGVQVQGEPAPGQITRAIEWFNTRADMVDVLVITRGGGSADDLQAFSTEQVTRAVSASRIPTLVAIGHEVDISLAELAADLRASTPSNAAELLVPERREQMAKLQTSVGRLDDVAMNLVSKSIENQGQNGENLHSVVKNFLDDVAEDLKSKYRVLNALSPQAVLERGYAVVRGANGKVIKSSRVAKGSIDIRFADGNINAEVQ